MAKFDNRTGVHIADTLRLCQSIDDSRSRILGLNAEYTEILRLPEEEVTLELEIFDGRLRTCLEHLLLLKDEYFHDRFGELAGSGTTEKFEGVMQCADLSAHKDDHLQAVEYEDLWREFLGLYCSCLVMAAKICETKGGQEATACALYDRIILLCASFGAYTNLDYRGRADGRSVTVSRFRVRLAILKFSQLKWQEAEKLATDALFDFGAENLYPSDPDFESAMNILRFLKTRT